MQIKDDFVAQLVEQLTLNQWAVGSSPTEVTPSKTALSLKKGRFHFYLRNYFSSFYTLGTCPNV